MFRKKLMAGLLIACMGISAFAGCGSKEKEKESEKTVQAEAGEPVTFTIGIAQSIDNDYYNQITQGFRDGLDDYFDGNNSVNLKEEVVSEENGATDIITKFLNANADLIFTNGEATLTAASGLTSQTPVVGAGVIDYQSTLHIADDGWGSKTGTNITGISSRPPIAAQLSMMIESTEDLQTVGILYCPEDSNAIYQDEILENYLDQAGIPWKEYELPVTDSAMEQQEEESETEAAGSAIEPDKIVAASSIEGVNNVVESLGEENVITGINSTNSARAAKQSDNFEPKTVTLVTEETEEVPYASRDNNDSTEAIVKYAASECSAFFIASDNLLNDQMESICSIATEAGVTTTGADTSIGAYTLTTLYSDPYDMGYRAAKLAKKILLEGSDPGTIKISGVDVEDAIKLYQDTVAEAFDMTFPKSFTEFDEYMENYEVGQNTKRVEKTTEE